MQPINIALLFVCLLCAAILVIVFMLYKSVLKEKIAEKRIKELERNEALKYYDSDIIIITDQILRAKNIWHLKEMVNDIHAFKLLYAPHKCPIDLQIDYKRMLRIWKEAKDSMEVMMAILN